MSPLQEFLESLDPEAADDYLEISSLAIRDEIGDGALSFMLPKILSLYDEEMGCRTDIETVDENLVLQIWNYFHVGLYLTKFESLSLVKKVSGEFSFKEMEKCQFEVGFNTPNEDVTEFLIPDDL